MSLFENLLYAVALFVLFYIVSSAQSKYPEWEKMNRDIEEGDKPAKLFIQDVRLIWWSRVIVFGVLFVVSLIILSRFFASESKLPSEKGLEQAIGHLKPRTSIVPKPMRAPRKPVGAPTGYVPLKPFNIPKQ